MHPFPVTVMRLMAVVIILLNVDVALGALVAAGYGLATALTAAGTIGAVTTEIVARLLGGGTPEPPALPQ